MDKQIVKVVPAPYLCDHPMDSRQCYSSRMWMCAECRHIFLGNIEKTPRKDIYGFESIIRLKGDN